jgi:hypothetical protein
MSGSNNYRHILAIELSISHLAPVDRSANSLTLGYPQAAFLRRVGSPRIKKRQDRCTPTSRFDRGKINRSLPIWCNSYPQHFNQIVNKGSGFDRFNFGQDKRDREGDFVRDRANH